MARQLRRTLGWVIVTQLCLWQAALAMGDMAKDDSGKTVAQQVGQQKELAANDKLIVLTYHNIVADSDTDPYSTSHSAFVAHMDYLQTHGYKPVSLGLVEKAYNKQAILPPKAVLLTFDDGLKSYASFVVPILKTYRYPSVLSVVTGWLDGKDLPPEYVGKLLSWEELRALKQSPLISIISHTHDLHHFVQSNPQGNEAAAGTTRIYNPQSASYETEAQFRQRVAMDMRNTVQRFRSELGYTPSAITWPYGKYDGVLREEARAQGMKFQLTLDEGPATLETMPLLNRVMLGDYGLDDFVAELDFQRVQDERDYFVEIRLDPFVGLTPEAQNQLLSNLLDNLERLKVTAVLIHPFDSASKKVFFTTEKVALATDMLNRVATQINSRLNIRRIYLALSGASDSLLTSDVITDMSRLVWFNGIVFDKQTSARIGLIEKITAYYHPGIKFGRYINDEAGALGESNKLAFSIVRVVASKDDASMRQQLLASKGMPGKVLVSISLPEKSTYDFESMFSLLSSLSIRNFGFAYNKNIYGLKNNSHITHERATDAVAVFGG